MRHKVQKSQIHFTAKNVIKCTYGRYTVSKIFSGEKPPNPHYRGAASNAARGEGLMQRRGAVGKERERVGREREGKDGWGPLQGVGPLARGAPRAPLRLNPALRLGQGGRDQLFAIAFLAFRAKRPLLCET